MFIDEDDSLFGPNFFKQKEEDTLEATWWLFDREEGMDDLMEQAGESLQPMFDKLKVEPFQDTEENKRLFLARFELPKYEEDLQFPEAILQDAPYDPLGFVDFLGGFPLECVEMLVLIGEHSSKEDKTAVVPGDGYAAPPVPDEFFAGYDADRILLNYLYLNADNVDWMAENLSGEEDPTNLHWWLRVNLMEKCQPSEGGGVIQAKFPLPGEFLGLGVRLMPDKAWGAQKSSPFLFAGNWMDTVYYTGGRITEVIEPDDDFPYPRYKVQWRVAEGTDNEGIVDTAIPSDFAEYKAEDRVTIIKDVGTDKKTQLWKDDDMKKFGGEKDNWQIAPITFYGLDQEE